MTNAADSAARQVPYGESGRERLARESGDVLPGTSTHQPVFAAFAELGLTGRDVATFAGVTPPTVSKWRVGKVRIPGERLAFISLVLAHLLDEAPETLAGQTDWAARLGAAGAYLAYQDVLNQDLAASDVREGAQLFRAWWSSGAAKRLQEKRFTSNEGEQEEHNVRPMA